MSEQSGSSLPSQRKKSGVLSLAAKFEQQQDSTPSLSFKGRARKASVSSPYNSFASNGRESPRFPSPSTFLEKANSFLKKPLTSPTSLRKVNIPKSFSSSPDLEKPAPNKLQPGKLADLSTTTTRNEFNISTPNSAYSNAEVADDELSSISKLNSNAQSDFTETSNFTSTTRTLDPDSSDTLKTPEDDLPSLVENHLVDSKIEAKHEPFDKQAEQLLPNLSHLSSPIIDSALPVDQASDHVLESISPSDSSYLSNIQHTSTNNEDEPTGSHTLSQMQASELASLSAFDPASNVSNKSHLNQPESFAETSLSVHTTKDESVSSQVASEKLFESELIATDDGRLPIPEQVVSPEMNLSEKIPLTEEKEFVEHPEEHKVIENQTISDSTFASSNDGSTHLVDSSLGFSSSDISQSSLPLVTEKNSTDSLNFTETKEPFSQTALPLDIERSFESAHSVAELQDQFEFSDPDQLPVLKTSIDTNLPQPTIDSFSSRDSYTPSSEVTGEPQHAILDKSVVDFDLVESSLESDREVNYSGTHDLGLNTDSGAPRDIFASTVEDIESSSESVLVDKPTQSSEFENHDDGHKISSDSKIEKSIETTPLEEVLPDNVTKVSDKTADFAVKAAAPIGVTELVESKSETSLLTDEHTLDEQIVFKKISEDEDLRSSNDSISSTDEFYEPSSEVHVDQTQHLVESFDDSQVLLQSNAEELSSVTHDRITAVDDAATTATFVPSIANQESFSETSVKELEPSFETKTISDLDSHETILKSPASSIVSRDSFVSASEITVEPSEQPTEDKFVSVVSEEKINPAPTVPFALSKTHESPFYRARSPGADIWTPAPPSTDSSPELEPWSPKEVHFSLPNSPVATVGLAMPAQLSDAEQLQLSDVEDPSTSQIHLSESPLDASEHVDNNNGAFASVLRELSDESNIESVSVEKSEIKPKESVFESASDEKNQISSTNTGSTFNPESRTLSINVPNESHISEMNSEDTNNIKAEEISSQVDHTVNGVAVGTAAATVTAAVILHNDFTESNDSSIDSELEDRVGAKLDISTSAEGFVPNDPTSGLSGVSINNNDVPFSNEKLEDHVAELALPQSRDLPLEQEPFNEIQLEADKFSHTDDASSEDESVSYGEAETGVLPVEKVLDLENSLEVHSVSLSSGGVAVAATAVSSVAAHIDEPASVSSPSIELNGVKDSLLSQSAIAKHNFSPISAARSPGAAQWTPEPPSTDSSPVLEPWSPKEVQFSFPPSPAAPAQTNTHSQLPAEILLPDPLIETEDVAGSRSLSMNSTAIGASSLVVAGAAAASTILDDHQPLAISDEALETEQVDSHILAVSDDALVTVNSSIEVPVSSASQFLVKTDVVPSANQLSKENAATSFTPQSPAEAARSPGAAIWSPAPSSTDSSPVLEPWSPKEVQFSFSEAFNNASVEPLELASTSRGFISDNKEVVVGLDSAEEFEDNTALPDDHKNDKDNESFFEADDAVLGAVALGAAAAASAAAVKTFSFAEPTEDSIDKSLELDAESLNMSESSKLVEPLPINLSPSAQIQETSTFDSDHENEFSTELHELEEGPSISTERHQNTEIVRSNLESPKVTHRSPGADVWTPAPSSTDSSPALEPWSPKEVHFSLPSSPVINEQASIRENFSDLSGDASSTSLLEPISLDEPISEHSQNDDSLDEMDKAGDIVQFVADDLISSSVLTAEENTSSLEETAKDVSVSVVDSETDAYESHTFSSATGFATAGVGIAAGVAAGVSHAIKSHADDADAKDGVSAFTATELLSNSETIGRSNELDTPVSLQAVSSASTISDSTTNFLNEQLERSNLNNTNATKELEAHLGQTDDATSKEPLLDNSRISNKIVTDSEESENEVVTVTNTLSTFDAITFKDPIHRSPGAFIWTPEPSSTESSPDMVPWSPKEVHFSLPNSPVATATSVSTTVPSAIEPLTLGNNLSEAVARGNFDSDFDDRNLTLSEPLDNSDVINAEDVQSFDDSKNLGVSEKSFALPIVAAAAAAITTAPAIVSSINLENATDPSNLVESIPTKNIILSSTVEPASVDNVLTSDNLESPSVSDSNVAHSAVSTSDNDLTASRNLEFSSDQTTCDSDRLEYSTDTPQSYPYKTPTPKLLSRSPGAAIWTPEPPSTDSSPVIEPWSPKEVQFSIPESPAANNVDLSELSTAVLPPLGSTSANDTNFTDFEPEFKQTVGRNIPVTSESVYFDTERNSVPSDSEKFVPASPKLFLEESLPLDEAGSESESEKEFEFSNTTGDNELINSSAVPARNFPIPARELYKDVGVFLPSESEFNDDFVSKSNSSISNIPATEDKFEDQEKQQINSRSSSVDFHTTAPLAIGASTLGASAVLDSALTVNKLNGLNTKFTSESTSTLTVSDSLDDESSNASFVSTTERSPAMYSDVPVAQQQYSPSRSISEESFVSVSEDKENDNRLSMASSVNILESFVAESTQALDEYSDYVPQSPVESESSFRSLNSSPGEGNVTASLLDPVPRTVIDSHMGVQKSEIETQTINISASIPNLSSIQPEEDPLYSDSDSGDEKEGDDGLNNLPMESLFARPKSAASEAFDVRSSTPIEAQNVSYSQNGSLSALADNTSAPDSSLKSLFTFNEPAPVASLNSDLESYDDFDNSQEIHSSSDISDDESVIAQNSFNHNAAEKDISDLPHVTPVTTSLNQSQDSLDSEAEFDDVSQISAQNENFHDAKDHLSQSVSVPISQIQDEVEKPLSASNTDSISTNESPMQSSILETEFSHASQEKSAPVLQDWVEDKTKESQFDFRENSTNIDSMHVSETYGSPVEVENPANLIESKVWDEEGLDRAAYSNVLSAPGENGSFDFAETTVRSEISFPATSEANSKSPETPRSQVSFSSPAKTPAALTEDVLTEDIEPHVNQEPEEILAQSRSVSNSTERSLEDDWFALSKPEATTVSAFTEMPISKSADETFTFPSLQKSLPDIPVSSPEVDSRELFVESLDESVPTLKTNSEALKSNTSLSESVVVVETEEKPLPSLVPPALLPDPTIKSRRTPSVTLTPIVKETEPAVKDDEDIIFAVCVVGFHHAHGPQVEYWKGCDGDQSKLWPDLPFQSLPDGSHSREENFCYFTLPYDKVNKTAPLVVPTRDKKGEITKNVSDMSGVTTLFGISCNRQISADDLKERPVDVTRSTVQKSVVVIARKPIFGPIREKLAVITRAFFEQGDFSDLSLIDNLYDNLNSLFDAQLDENDMYVGMSLRELIFHMKNNVLVLLKALLLEKRIIFFSKNTENLCSSQFSLVSLVPALLEHLEDSCSPLLHRYEDTVKKPLSLRSSDRKSLLKFMGLPLQPFSEGGMFNPYLPLQQFNEVNAPESKSFLVGSTNSLIVESCECDLVVNFDQGNVVFKDTNLKKVLALSNYDKKWMDYITQSVVETWDPKDPWKPKGLGFHGSEDFVRQQFEDYIMSFMSSVKYDEFLSRFGNSPPKTMMLREVDGNPIKLFSQPWVQEWKKTNNYHIFSRITDDEIFDIVEPKHMANTLMPPKETHQRSTSTLSQISFFSSKSDESKNQLQTGGNTSPVSAKTWGSFLWRKPEAPSSPTSSSSSREEGLNPGRMRASTVSTNHSGHTLEPIMSSGSADDHNASPSEKSASKVPPAATTATSQAATARRTASGGGFLSGWSLWGSRKPAAPAAPAAPVKTAEATAAVSAPSSAEVTPTEETFSAGGLDSSPAHAKLQPPELSINVSEQDKN